jgi:hypothetical protein
MAPILGGIMGFTFTPIERNVVQKAINAQGTTERASEPRDTIKRLFVDPFLNATDDADNALEYGVAGQNEDGSLVGFTWQLMAADDTLSAVTDMIEAKNKSLSGSTVKDLDAIINRYAKKWGVRSVKLRADNGEISLVLVNIKRQQELREAEVKAASEAVKAKREAAAAANKAA